MIEVNGPVRIKTEMGSVLITVQNKDGKILIETFQRHGKRKYWLDVTILDGTLNEEKIYEK